MGPWTGLSRTKTFLAIAFFCCYNVPSLCQMRYTVAEEEGKAINQSYILQNNTLTNLAMTMSRCLQHCLSVCRCSSFQICKKRECQLSWTNKVWTPEIYREDMECVYFDLKQKETRASNQQCKSGCRMSVNCCLTSNPCENGGTCLPELIDARRHYKCLCKPGYTGKQCERRIPKSCRGYAEASRNPGIYEVLDQRNNSYQVFCDFDSDSEPRVAWTLIQSYRFSERGSIRSFSEDKPMNAEQPSWNKYRLPKHKMTSIQGDSKKWRITCAYDILKYKSTRRIVGYNAALDILASYRGCAKVEYISAGYRTCSDCMAYFRQDADTSLHHQSGKVIGYECQFMAGKTISCGDPDYFGDYSCRDKDHLCSMFESSTTQTWFGGE